jgi:hypothetical protein
MTQRCARSTGVFCRARIGLYEAADQRGLRAAGSGRERLARITRQLAPGRLGLDRDVLADWAFGVLIVGHRGHGRRSPSRPQSYSGTQAQPDAVRCCAQAESHLRYCLVWPINSLAPFVALLTVLTPAKAAVPTRGATLN